MVERAVSIPAAAIARFTDAEARLYPMAMVDAAGYERATALVGLMVAELRRSCPDIGSVLQRRHDLIAELPAVAAGAQLSLAGLPAADVVIDAASALRCRELQAAGSADALKGRIDAARRAGHEWLVDEPDPASVMGGCYRRVELHLPTNTTLITSIEADRPGTASTYTIELIPGEKSPGTAPSHTWVYPDRDAWVAAADRFRVEMSAGH
jgi:hypothetical protein